MVAERLRRWTRNPMGFPRAGSNPAHSEYIFVLKSIYDGIQKEAKIKIRPWWDLNPQSPAPEADALSIRP